MSAAASSTVTTRSAGRRAPAPWPWRLPLATVLTGVLAGAGGVVLTLLLHAVQHLGYGYTENTFLIGAERAAAWRRVVVLGAAGVVVGAGWWALRRRHDEPVSVTHALRSERPRRWLPVPASTADAALQIIGVGAGASLGREGAPRQVGAVLGALSAQRLGLSAAHQRLLLACGAGAGLAAVYNVPIGGAAFTVELLVATRRWWAIPAAVVTSAVATVVAWPVLGTGATYDVTRVSPSWSLLVAGLVIGPLAGILGRGFRALMTAARTRAPSGWRAAVSIPVGFAALGLLAAAYPQLLGNGKGPAQLAFSGTLGVGLALALTLLKPVATAACLRAGAIGGLLTPAFATGSTGGWLAGHLWTQFWPGSPAVAYAFLGAGALLAVTQRAPVTAVVLTVEFTHQGLQIVPVLIVAVAVAVVTDRAVGRRLRTRKAGRTAQL